MQYQWDFAAVWSHFDMLIVGLIGTVELALVSILLGVIVGFLVALMRLSHRRALRTPATAFVEFYRNTPPIVHFFWFFYALPIVIGLSFDPFTGRSARVVDAVRRVLRRSVSRRNRVHRAWPVGRREGARHELSRCAAPVILPQALRRMVAPFVDRSFELTKTTALASSLAYAELLYQAMQVNSITYRPMEVYTTIALMYFIVLFAASNLMRLVEYRLSRVG